MKNSDLFYNNAMAFQNKRKGIMDTYDKRIASLEPMRGSQYFKDEVKKATETRDNDLKNLRAEYKESFNKCLEFMRTANGKRGMKPPTEEQLRILQVLKMKDKVTEQELESASNALRDNGICLSALQEIAMKNNIMRSYTNHAEATELPIDTVDGMIKGIEKTVTDFMMYDTKRPARIAREHNERLYGVDQNAVALPKRSLFYDKAGCFNEIGGINTNLKAFCEAVDGE